MANRLANATSPYLLQHKDNPVDWYEWGDEPFLEARRRDLPVLLSVGYAACHWCHVMAHESFEDPETAAEMNRLFVNIKVDREERPDVDSIYMESVQAMSGHGGWPMTVWLDHERRPFFAGTYFPNEPRHGMATFREVMEAVSTAWTTRRVEVAEQAGRLVAAISAELPVGSPASETTLRAAYDSLEGQFDPVHGGFGGAPKFPQQPVLEFLLRVHGEVWAPRSAQMLEHTLDEMAAGGIHDQIGGGFARYSVDTHWLVPHFEKMLYDNAQLARIYLWAGVELDRPDFLDVARSTLDYLARDLCHTEGGFFSSEDADSEGVEGKFYVWSESEIRELLGARADEVIDFYGVTAGGNFEGSNILNVVATTTPDGLESAKKALLDRRSARIRPGLDDKVISAWNGLAIRAFAEAGAVLGNPSYLDSATACAEFILEHLIVEGRLMRSWRDGRTSVPGFLDDHAATAIGMLSLYQATGDNGWYERAVTLANGLDAFENPDGGFFSTSVDQQGLIKRPTDNTDNPLPSGNALAAEALATVGLLSGEAEPMSRAEQALGSAALMMERYPSMVGHHLSVSYSLSSSKELAIVGGEPEPLLAVYWSRFRPHVVLAVSTDEDQVVPLLRNRLQPGRTLAYVCEAFICDLPTADPEELAVQLG